MPANKVILKFNDSLTVKMKNAMASHGFTHYARKVGEWIMFSKDVNEADKSVDFASISNCLEAIVNTYHDPYGCLASLRCECVDFVKKLSDPQAKAWGFEWIEENIDHDLGGDPPWEDEDWQPNLGFC